MKGTLKPNLAADAVLGQITYPKLYSPKYNGMRAWVVKGKLLARSLKPIPNHHCQVLFADHNMEGFDGELIVGPYGAPDVFTRTTSGVKSADGKPDVRFYVFDLYHPKFRFLDRIKLLAERVHELGDLRVIQAPHYPVGSDEEVRQMHDEWVAEGYEGGVLRDPNALYKCGRSTQEEQGFLRFCDWHRSEAVILAIEEKQENTNPQETNELGYTKRSSAKAGKVGLGVAGSMHVMDIKTKVQFNIPISGDELCDEMWRNRVKYNGKIAKYKYRTKVKTAPRFPQFEGIRAPEDMS